MLREILWLKGGDAIFRGTGMQIQYNYVRSRHYSWKMFFNYSIRMSRPFAPSWRVQQLFSVSQQKTALFVWAAA